MLATTDKPLTLLASDWLQRFERALASPAALRDLFGPDSHWRDVLALTWRLRTVDRADAIAAELSSQAASAKPSGFRIDPDRTQPRRVKRAGTEAVEAIFRFETREGHGCGVVRLRPDASGSYRAWTLHTALDGLKGHEEQIGHSRPKGSSYSREFRGPNWLDRRKTAEAYADRDPAVLVVGGGQAGLSIAARLNQLQVDTLIVDRLPRVGDNWRKRYHALTLHNQVHTNHLPYMHFPPNWPIYIPKDKLAGWFESYVECMELNYWTGTELLGGHYDEAARRWTVKVRRPDGGERTMYPRHVVLATGVSGIPNRPDIPTLQNFSGPILHSTEFGEGHDWTGKRALILGTGTSAHDIAQDLVSNGAQATLVQRSSTMVINVEPSAQLPYALYDEGPPLEDCDLITTSMPLSLLRKTHIMLTEQARKLDQPLLDALERKGFQLDFGDEGTGWQFKYLTRGGGYYFNVGCSDLIIEGKVGLVQYSDISEFVANGAQMKSGEVLPADLVVLATGYKGQEVLVGKLFGDDVAARVGPIWGFGEDQELRNMFTRTRQPGLWLIAGSFAQCRIYSKYLGLQIKACELGLLSPVEPAA
jgi:putative flavoprotein involved in K+ transport